MNSTVVSINKEYRSLIKRAQDKFENKWVRKKVWGGEKTGTITHVYLNNAHPAGLKVTVKWNDGAIEEGLALADLEEY